MRYVKDPFRKRLSEELDELFTSVRQDHEGRPVLGFVSRTDISKDEVPFRVLDKWSAPMREQAGLYESRETGERLYEFTVEVPDSM